MGITGSHELHPGVKELVLSGELVRGLRERFELISDSFGFDREEIRTLYKAKPNQVDIIFEMFDPHGRDKVDAYEFIAGMIIISEASLEMKADILFELYDFDHSQSLSFDELIIMLRTAMNALCYMTNNQPITMEELEDHTTRVFAKIDTNSDNSISLNEWVSFITRDVEVVNFLEAVQLITLEDKRPNWGSEDSPEMDSDLENETNRRELTRSAIQERVKEGVEVLDDTPFLLESVGEGDQFLAVKPWEGVVKNSVPSNYQPRKGEDDPPNASLELEYVHGYRCHDVRNNLRYTAKDEVVYHTAAVGIVLSPGPNTQKHFIAHTDDIISFDANATGALAATGEIGRTPLLTVWNTDTMDCVKSYKGIFKRGISNVAFSPDSTKVAGMGSDEEHCVIVYEISKSSGKPGPMQNVYASGKAGRDTFLDMRFHPASNDKIIACGVKIFQIMTIAGGTVTVKKGTGWGKTPQTQQQALQCIAVLGASILTGAFNGCIFKWTETTLTQAVKVHEGAITCFGQRTSGDGIISGGIDGFIHVLDISLNKIKSIDLKTLGSLLPKPRSACEGKNGKLLIGTRGGEIFEVTGNNSKILMKGHYDLELWGLASHPSRNEYATLGQDGLLAIWDAATRKQKTCVKMEGPGGVLAYSPNGAVLVGGLTNGKIIILDGVTLAIKGSKHDRIKQISEIKFSPDGQVLAVGAHDSLIFTYRVNDNFTLQYKLKGHSSTITHSDFSVAGGVLQSTSASYELLYHNVDSGAHDPSGASGNRNERWYSWNCVLGWPVQGIWPPCSDGSDINNLDRSKSHKVIATVDDFGQVKLFKYPCVKKNSGFNSFRGHSSHVTNCRFLPNSYLISTGGNDKAIFQWKYIEEGEDPPINDEALQAVEPESKLFDIETVGEGDQFLAVKPWLGEVKASAPNDWVTPKNHAKPPDENMVLLKVHGYRCFDSRNNLRYSSTGKAVYPAAALGVVMDLVSKEQKFFSMHDDDVVCLAIHPNRRIAATGQMVHVGKSRNLDLHVWDIETLQDVACLTGFHRRAIRHVDFSPNGNLVLSIGEDDDHSLAVYEWQTKRMVCNSKVDKDAVLGANFITNTELAIYGPKFIKFFTINGQNISNSRGSIGVNKPFEAQFCGAVFNNAFVTGTHAGNLFVWGGKSLAKSVKAHTGQVWALFSKNSKLYSGGSEGNIVIWDASYKQLNSISLAEVSINPGIRSIDVNDQESLLIGTRGADILEIKDSQEFNILGNGHYDGELWGLTMHPSAPICATCGGDKTIRTWDLIQGNMIASTRPLAQDLRALDYSPNGKMIVCGLINGMILIVDAENLTTINSVQSSFKGKDCWIEDIKFSPNGSQVAFGAHGGASKLEVMGIQGTKLVKLFTVNAGLTSALTHLDWSVDGSLVAVNSQAYELKFVSVDAKRNVASSSVKGTEWRSWTCVLGWPVQFIWPECADGTDVNSCCRSNSRTVLATADDFGKVNFFRWPVVVQKQSCKSFLGHSSHVTKVKFSVDDAFVVSTGGNDKCVFVWQTDMASDAEPDTGSSEDTKTDDIGNYKVTEKKNDENREKAKKKIGAALENNDPNSFFQFEELGEGDQFLAVKPWEGAMKPPSGFVKAARNQNTPPAVNLELEFVHGYRGKDCRNNLRYLNDGRIIYHAAGLGIVYNKSSHSQSFFNKHIDDIIAFALSPNREVAATGEVGRKPNIFVWDTSSMMQIANFKAPLEKGITALSFSPNGSILAAVGMDDDHSVALYNLRTSSLICSVKGDREVITDMAFTSETEFVTTGIKHFKGWTISGTTVTGKRGQFGTANNMLLCVGVDGPNVYTGTAAGTLVKWAGVSAGKSYPLHQKGLDSIWVNHGMIVTGGKDGIVLILDSTLNKRQSFDLNANQYGSICPFIRSAMISDDGSALLVSTYGCELYEIDMNSGQGRSFNRGHYTPSRGRTVTNEVWGLCVLPDNNRYISCSDDGTLRVWDRNAKAQVHLIRFSNAEEIPDSAKSRSVSCNQQGNLIAVGFKDGSFKVYDTNTWAQRVSKKDRKEEIGDLKFSPDGSKLAVGSHDNFIDIYNASDFKQIAVCRGHSSFITHFDWSCDGNYLHSNCGAYELLFWDSNNGRQLTSGASMLKDEQWHTWTCVIGWPVQGIYPAFADGTDVNAVDRSKIKFGNKEYEIVATSDDFGLLKIFRYPCLTKGSEGVIGRGHSSHVTNVRFSPDDAYIFTTGGDDQCVFQWKISSK